MSNTIFVITNNDDGYTTVRQTTEVDFVEQLNQGWYGNPPVFVENLDKADTSCWPEGAICVIRGSLVIPISKEVVKVWQL